MELKNLQHYNDANSNSKKAPPISLEIVSWLKERTSQQGKDSCYRAVADTTKIKSEGSHVYYAETQQHENQNSAASTFSSASLYSEIDAFYWKIRGDFKNSCDLLRREISHLQTIEETLFNDDAVVSEAKLESYEVQFEVCSGLFTVQRERKVMLMSLLRQRNSSKTNNVFFGNKQNNEHTRQKEANIMPNEVENHHNSNQIRHSCGRTRQDLNKMRFGHSYGMFASFGHDEFCIRRRGGCIQISHLILTPSCKESSISRQQQFQIKTGKTKLKRLCGSTLSRMREVLPVFFAYPGDACIYYVGNWKPLATTETPSNKEFIIELEFCNFDDTIAKAMSNSSEPKVSVKEDVCSVIKKEEAHCQESLLLPSLRPRTLSSSSAMAMNGPKKIAFTEEILGAFTHFSCGRTKKDLNKLRLGHNHGMFASFGNQEFCFRKRGVCIEISHLVVYRESCELSIGEPKVLKFSTKRPKTKLMLNCERALSRMKAPLPVFYDPRKIDKCIYYVGHWLPLHVTARQKSFSLQSHDGEDILETSIELEFDKFDDNLAKSMTVPDEMVPDAFVKTELSDIGLPYIENRVKIEECDGKSSVAYELRRNPRRISTLRNDHCSENLRMFGLSVTRKRKRTG